MTTAATRPLPCRPVAAFAAMSFADAIQLCQHLLYKQSFKCVCKGDVWFWANGWLTGWQTRHERLRAYGDRSTTGAEHRGARRLRILPELHNTFRLRSLVFRYWYQIVQAS
jgi:hypothetical protein